MAKKIKNQDNDAATAGGKSWKEGEIIKTFQLNRIISYQTPLMQEWLDVTLPELNPNEQYMLDKVLVKAQKRLRINRFAGNKFPDYYTLHYMNTTTSFVIMDSKDYCISETFDAINRKDLMMIIAILRKFKYILDTRLYE